MMVQLFLSVLMVVAMNPCLYANDTTTVSEKGEYGTIAGHVFDENNLTLPGATVMIEKVKVGVVANSNGYYRIARLNPGHYDVTVSYIGFQKVIRTAQVEEGKTTTLDFHLKAGVELNEVVITGSLQGRSRALNQQKNSINISNIISADQVGRFPDANMGDALKRIPGINVEYDQGEARFGHVRGTSPDLNSVTINGERIPSAEADTRAIQLDLVPSDMVQTIEVSKVVTPDMDADAIGGAINLVTRDAPYERRLSGTLGGHYNLISDRPTLTGAFIYGDRFFNDKLGVILSASYQNHQLGSDNIEAVWKKGKESEDAYISDFQIRTYEVQRERQSYSASFDYAFNDNHKIELKGIFNHRKDWENRYRLRFKGIELAPDGSWMAEIRRETKGGRGSQKNTRLEDQKSMDFSLKGKHFFGAVQWTWKLGYARASEHRPHERYISYRAKETPINVLFKNSEKPQIGVNDPNRVLLNENYQLKDLYEESRYTSDVDNNFRTNFKVPIIGEGNFANSLSAGFVYKEKAKKRDNKYRDYAPLNETEFDANSLSNLAPKTKTHFLAGNYSAGNFVTNTYLGKLNFENTSKFTNEASGDAAEKLAENFNAEEKIIAGYVRFDQKIGKRLSLLAGLRVENTQLKYAGHKLLIDDDGKTTVEGIPYITDSYTNILPALIAKYSFSENTKLKMAWTNTIARPKYSDLAPHVSINIADSEGSEGNPSLNPTTSMNVDVMFEHYYGNVGLLSGGVFYKHLQEVVVDQTLINFNYNDNIFLQTFKKPINAGNADLVGFELSFQRQFDFLGDFWKQFGIYANYTHTYSRLKNSGLKGREKEELPLVGTPKNIFNTSLFYDGKKLTVRVSLNYSDSFIDEVGSSAFNDRYYDKVIYLDVNAGYAISKKFRIFLVANNLLNTPLRYYQSHSKRTMQAEYYNVKFDVGLKFDL